MLMFGFSERPLMQMEKKMMQISLIYFVLLYMTPSWNGEIISFVELENVFWKQ